MKNPRQKNTSIRTHQQGAALIEFALLLPVLLTIALGSFEVVRFMLVTQKVDKAVSSIGNIVTQFRPYNHCPYNIDNLSLDRLDTVLHAGGGDGILTDLLRPYNGREGNEQGGNIFAQISWRMTSISNINGAPVTHWSYGCRDVYGRDACFRNDFEPALPTPGFDVTAMQPNENAIILNFDYRMPGIFRRWFGANSSLTDLDIRRSAIFTPRLGPLTELPQSPDPTICTP